MRKIPAFLSALILGITSVLFLVGLSWAFAKAIVKETALTIGGIEKLRALHDVEYKYTYLEKHTGKKDISIERYIFDGQLSWGRYLIREKNVLTDQPGEVIQGFNGKETWVSLNGRRLPDPKAIGRADFTRRTNFHWFAMMFKLVGPGVTYMYEGSKHVNGQDYNLVRVSFESGGRDGQDRNLLYINAKTRLVDQFLFIAMDLGRTEPFLMKVRYEEVDGIRVPIFRSYAASNWEGSIKEPANWVDEISEEIKFNNGFSPDLFEAPKR